MLIIFKKQLEVFSAFDDTREIIQMKQFHKILIFRKIT